jgi:Tfp pilus assembly protein PilV
MKLTHFKNSEIKLEKGFTIIETLVAITILMVAIVGPLTVAYKGLAAAVYARDQMIGSYLAQDAMEYIKNMRDNNLLLGQPWLNGLSLCLSTGGGTCRIDTITGEVNSCLIGSTCSRLNLEDTSDSGYTHTAAGSPSQFSRVVLITPSTNNGGNEATVRVTVAWKNGTVNNNVVIENRLFNTFR